MARWTDQQVEQAVGNLLRIGVLIAATVAAAGGLAYLARHGSTPVDYRAFQGAPQDLRSIRGIVVSAFSLRSLGVVQLGILLLIATPIARVTLSLIGFSRQGDRKYVAITALVLGILLFSLVGGRL
jgi:uncharacterized membrane protein